MDNLFVNVWQVFTAQTTISGWSAQKDFKQKKLVYTVVSAA